MPNKNKIVVHPCVPKENSYKLARTINHGRMTQVWSSNYAKYIDLLETFVVNLTGLANHIQVVKEVQIQEVVRIEKIPFGDLLDCFREE